MLIAHLPLESATQTRRIGQMSDEDWQALRSTARGHGSWSHTDLLLAGVVDALERLTFVQLRRAGVNAKQPDPIPRPGVSEHASVHPINPAARAYLERIRDQHRRQEA